MHKFYVGQPVIIGTHAQHSVGCCGRVVKVGKHKCLVHIDANGGYTREFDKGVLTPKDIAVTNPEATIQRWLDKLLAEAKQARAVTR
ncbi:hypothetical protein Alches_17490 [Alicyclobacillus hesperidum subsp. aegles]|uniref:hypothetical protein n=1 Tax=Alicyclobacillus hesperidum TaxID=89784 RepID=UPI00222B9F33|nr:hypothetical protein [Alicyclobacillus hesperidum]GLG01709.1 hypothetical protein Alches_17490 [Alicyclobacillus hesperidum subsp. aegles]